MLEFVSVLRRLVGGDTKAIPTADDRVLVIDAADNDKIKESRIGDLPQLFDLTSFKMVSANSIASGVFGHRLIGGSDCYLPATKQLLLVVNQERAPVNIYATQDGNQVIYTTEDGAILPGDAFVVPFASATLFVPFLTHWMAIRLNWS